MSDSVAQTRKDLMSGKQHPMPSDLLSMPGVGRGFDPVPLLRSRLVITGLPGTGKSTLIHSSPAVFVIGPEGGHRTVSDPKAYYAYAPDTTPPHERAAYYRSVISTLIERRRKGATDIQMIALDTFDSYLGVVAAELCHTYKLEDIGDYKGGHGAGYAKVRNDIFNTLDLIHSAGFGWCLIVHTQANIIKTIVDGKSVERLEHTLAVSQSFRGAIFQRCEHMLFMDRGTIMVPGEETTRIVNGRSIKVRGATTTQEVRRLRTSPGGLWKGGQANDVKARVPFEETITIPQKGGFDALTEAYDVAVKKLVTDREGV